MLEWENEYNKNVYSSDIEGYAYWIALTEDGTRWEARVDLEIISVHSTLEEAKAACKGHYLKTLKQAAKEQGYALVKLPYELSNDEHKILQKALLKSVTVKKILKGQCDG